jgi:hypothetical protein
VHPRDVHHRLEPGCAVSAKNRSLQNPSDGHQHLLSRKLQILKKRGHHPGLDDGRESFR